MVSFQRVELEHRAGRRGSEHRWLNVEPRRTLSRLPLQGRGTCDMIFVRRCTGEVQAASVSSLKGCGAHSREGPQPQLHERGSYFSLAATTCWQLEVSQLTQQTLLLDHMDQTSVWMLCVRDFLQECLCRIYTVSCSARRRVRLLLLPVLLERHARGKRMLCSTARASVQRVDLYKGRRTGGRRAQMLQVLA